MRILLAIFAILAVITATTSASKYNNYTKFDLFKNTGFVPCPVNDKTTADVSTTDFTASRWVTTQEQVCRYMAGTPVIIPTTPSQTAFFPWYPTYLLQAVSLSLSYFGLWLTLRSMIKQQGTPSVRIPRLFWIQLPFDAARIIAFLFKAIHGFADEKRLAWINVLLWLLPFTYIFIIYLAAQEQSTSPQYTYTPTPQGIQFQTPDHPEHKFQSTTEVQALSHSQLKAWNNIPTRWKVILISAAIGTILLFTFSLATTIKHWQFRWTSPTTALDKQTYIPTPEAISKPSAVGQLPDACLAYLTSGKLQNTEFFRQDIERKAFAVITTLQFVFSLSSLSAIFLGNKNHFSRSSRVLIISATITCLALLIPAFAVGMVIVKEKGAVLRFTNDLEVTGSCTFAFLAMKREVGYWDVPYELGFRIAMSFFGAA
jgi:hypothetical protein